MKYAESDTVLICAPTEWGQKACGIPGAVQGVCHECGQPVWIAPSGLAIQAEHDAFIVCLPCGMASIDANPGAQVNATKEQMKEIREALSRRKYRDN
jgi:hypothetical protein